MYLSDVDGRPKNIIFIIMQNNCIDLGRNTLPQLLIIYLKPVKCLSIALNTSGWVSHYSRVAKDVLVKENVVPNGLNIQILKCIM